VDAVTLADAYKPLASGSAPCPNLMEPQHERDKYMRKRLAVVLAVVAAALATLAAVAVPAQSDNPTEIRSRTLTVPTGTPDVGFHCTPEPDLIEIIGPTVEPAEAEGWLFIQERVGEMCVQSDWPDPVEVTLYYLALKH
jgi:hypothetical protein